MTRIADEWLACVFYLYPSMKDAKAGNALGATGFFASVPWSDDQMRHNLYAVTNKHCITACRDAVVIRATTATGILDFKETDPVDWHPDPDNDLSILPIEPDKAPLFGHISSKIFLQPADVVDRKIGPGEEVFMIGRFIKHDGRTENHPSTRFGNLSMLPANIRQPSGVEQESFAVDMRSISGYSGSPAFVYWTFMSGGLPGAPNRPFDQSFVALLGVDWGHIEIRLPVRMRATLEEHPDKLYVNSHTSMSGVVPAWNLAYFLAADRFKEQRMNDEREMKKKEGQEPGSTAFDFAEADDDNKPTKPKKKARKGEAEPGHRERFNQMLGGAVKPPKSSGRT